jgi:hypothetical protein
MHTEFSLTPFVLAALCAAPAPAGAAPLDWQRPHFDVCFWLLRGRMNASWPRHA